MRFGLCCFGNKLCRGDRNGGQSKGDKGEYAQHG